MKIESPSLATLSYSLCARRQRDGEVTLWLRVVHLLAPILSFAVAREMVNEDVRDARYEQQQLDALHRLDEECVHLQRAGNYLQAFDNMERALVLRRHFFGADSPEVVHACRALAEMCNLLSMSFLQQDNFAVTLELLKKAEILSQHHPKEKATTLNNLACYYRRLGKLHTAMTCLKKALSIEKKTLKDARNAADTHLNICAVLSQLGKHQQALEHAQAALVTLQEKFFNKPKASMTGDSESESTSQTNVQQLERVSVMCIAYHNMGVEQEFLTDYEGCVLSYKKGVGLAEQYLGVDHAIATTIRNSYLAAKRTISTKASSSRRGNGAISPVSKPNPRLSTPPPSLRLPSPVTKDKQQRQELPSPRSIVADALARGNTLPPLEPIHKKRTSLTPEDPFFSPRFRFEGAGEAVSTATKAKNQSPRVIVDEPQKIPCDERQTDAVTTEADCTRVMADMETIQAVAEMEDLTEPPEASPLPDYTVGTTKSEPNSLREAPNSTEDAHTSAATVEEPDLADAETLHESEGVTDRIDMERSHLQDVEGARAPLAELVNTINDDEEPHVEFDGEQISDPDDGNVPEPIGGDSLPQEPSPERIKVEINDPASINETSGHEDDTVQEHEATFSPHHIGEETTTNSERLGEELAADQPVESQLDDPSREATADEADHEASHAETEPPFHIQDVQSEAEQTVESADEKTVEEQNPTAVEWDPERTLEGVNAIAETSTTLSAEGDPHELADERADAVPQVEQWGTHVDEAVPAAVDAQAHDEDRTAGDEAADQWIASTDATEENKEWPLHHTEEMYTHIDYEGIHAHDETPVYFDDDATHYAYHSEEATWDPSQHAAEGDHELHAQMKGEEAVVQAEGLAYADHPAHFVDDLHTRSWSSHELTTEEADGHQNVWSPSQAADHDVEAHGIYHDSSGAVYMHYDHEEGVLMSSTHEVSAVAAIAAAADEDEAALAAISLSGDVKH